MVRRAARRRRPPERRQAGDLCGAGPQPSGQPPGDDAVTAQPCIVRLHTCAFIFASPSQAQLGDVVMLIDVLKSMEEAWTCMYQPLQVVHCDCQMCDCVVTPGHDAGGAVAAGVARVHQALLRLPKAAGRQGEQAAQGCVYWLLIFCMPVDSGMGCLLITGDSHCSHLRLKTKSPSRLNIARCE